MHLADLVLDAVLALLFLLAGATKNCRRCETVQVSVVAASYSETAWQARTQLRWGDDDTRQWT